MNIILNLWLLEELLGPLVPDDLQGRAGVHHHLLARRTETCRLGQKPDKNIVLFFFLHKKKLQENNCSLFSQGRFFIISFAKSAIDHIKFYFALFAHF